MAEKKIAQKKEEKPKKKPYQLPDVEPGDNARYIAHSMEIMRWVQPDMDIQESVEKRCFEYFALCEQNDMKPSFAEFALAFGVDRRTMWRWCNDAPGGRKLSDSVRDTIKKARDLINAQMESYMQNGKINPVAGIFLMKNNMNYTDQQEVVLKPENPLGERKDPEELRRKYLEDVYGAEADKIIDAEEAK